METQAVFKWMQLFAQKIQENKDLLSELDTPIGDGDHGGNMARGMAAVMEELEGKEFASSDQIFKVVSMQLLSKVGGASGPLYGSAFMGLTKSAQANDSLSDSLQAGLDMIQKRGKAEVGEKTMVDVWTPVIADLKAGQLSLESIRAAVDSTKDLQATKGRASYVGERSVGHIDPGSYSSGLLFEALVEAGLV
ncbi:dihydroxyacetone kinase subunit DhaL [Streptococcus himalayensis]|uniref:phosphoenolpyruvate--glycerone phosphotransferase n=1 Tax=Streptococcus himalayensis TaxID=1888195 RepID=A0A917A5N7_9STRE|nr:dihydroxyacetone kinase subunit DhaL [Streptococcus himalayensis]GGE26622.1 dihydroxyacetone kinase subunit L [Streptococcus himalayensis]